MSHEIILLFAVLFLFAAVAVLGVYVIKLLKWKHNSNYLPTLELHSDGEVWFKHKTLGGFHTAKILSYSDRIELLNRISNSKSEIGDALVQLATALGYERITTAAQPEKAEWMRTEKAQRLDEARARVSGLVGVKSPAPKKSKKK